jgi:hypothetical protein
MRSIAVVLGLITALYAAMLSQLAQAAALDSWPTWSVAQPYVSKQVPPGAMIMRGRGTNSYYVLEVDPATGEIPVSLAGAAISIDFSGPTGSPVPADAGFVGGVDGNGDLRGLSVDTAGVLDVNITGTATNQNVTIVGPLGQSNMAGSLPVTIANNQTAIPISNFPTTLAVDHGATDASTLRVTEGSKTYADSARYDYTGGSVTTAAWTQVLASTLTAMNYVCITDQSGQIMRLGTGAVAAETTVFMIPRGFSGCIPLRIAAATRLSLKAVSATASTGDFVLSGMN